MKMSLTTNILKIGVIYTIFSWVAGSLVVFCCWLEKDQEYLYGGTTIFIIFFVAMNGLTWIFWVLERIGERNRAGDPPDTRYIKPEDL